jgi:hypothetical protein
MKDEVYVGEKLWGYVESICGNGEGMENDQVEALTREQVQAFVEDVKAVCKRHNIEIYADVGGDVGFRRDSDTCSFRELNIEDEGDGTFTIGWISPA